MSRKIVEVAAAVIERKDGYFLLGRRPPNGIYAGWWEFPGGKVEKGEAPYDALVRELQEELGITVTAARPWITREHEYEHAHVRLHFFRVTDWAGSLSDLQHDLLAWQHVKAIDVAPVLPANAPVFSGLALPTLYGITQASDSGIVEQLRRLQIALIQGLRLVQIREHELNAEIKHRFAREAVKLCRQYGAKVLINGDIELAREVRADGVHLSAPQLLALQEKPGFEFVAASCHNREELDAAAAFDLNFVAVGTVLPTLSHPGRAALGWDKFSALIADYPLPVFALGGLPLDALHTAQQHGAHGIAAIRSVWANDSFLPSN